MTVDDAITTAVLQLVNSHGPAESEHVLRTHHASLLTDAADEVMLALIHQHRDDTESVEYLRGVWAKLYTCREHGIDGSLTWLREMPPELLANVRGFVNAAGSGDGFTYLMAHQDVLLSAEADRVLRYIAARYRDDPALTDHLAECRERLETARTRGGTAAFEDTVITVPQPIGDAVAAFLQCPYAELRDMVERDGELLLSDEAEAFLDFVVRHAENAEDDPFMVLMRERLTLIRRCRTQGVDTVFDRSIPDYWSAALVPAGTPGEHPSPQHLEDEFGEEIEALRKSSGYIDEDDLRTLLDRRPELADMFRGRLESGDAVWLKPRDYSFFGEMAEEVRLAWSRGEWERMSLLAESALAKLSRDEQPYAWAAAHNVAGTGRSRTPHGDRAENLELAIRHHLLAREVLEPERAVGWESNEHHLALAYLQRVRHDHATNVESAVDILRELIASVPETQVPWEWLTSYADALRQRVLGSRRENIRTAMAVLRACAERPDVRADPELRARTALALGIVMLDSASVGDAADGEQAIALLTETVPTLDPAVDTISWVHCHRSLATAYLRRHRGVPADNWAAALDLLARISSACPADRYPELWAENQLAVAALLTSHPDGLSLDVLKRAVDAMASTQAVYTRNDYPERWGKVQVNLGHLYGLTYGAGTEGADEQAVTHLDRAFQVYTREGAPHRWAMIHRNLGEIDLWRAERAGTPEERARFADRAVQHFRRVLDVRTGESDPVGCLDTLKLLSSVYFTDEQWDKALAVFVDAMRVSDRMLAGMYSEAGRLSAAGTSDWIHDRAAYCLFRLNDGHAALTCAEWGRGRTLAQTLALRDLDIADLPADLFERLRAARHRVRRLEADLRDDDASSTAIDELRTARQHLAAEVEAGRAHDPDLLRHRLQMSEMLEAIPESGAIVLPVITSAGSVVYCLIGPEDDDPVLLQVSIGWLTTAYLRALLYGTSEVPGWIPQYRGWRAGRVREEEWRTTLDLHLKSLGTVLAEPIESVLSTRLPDRAPVTIVLGGALAFLPLHASTVHGRCLLDRFVVSYVPSVYALRTSSRRLKAIGDTRLFAVADPTRDLPFARAEGEYLRRIPKARTVLFDDATEDEVRRAVSQHTHLHFACHGVHSREDTLRSGLKLADWDLDLRTVLAPEFDLSRVRLVTLSACETGLIAPEYALDEFIGLPTAFLQGGACGVISTLWPVHDHATAILMARFYHDHLTVGLPPAQALHGAQLWLRDSTTTELAAFLTECGIVATVSGDPDEPPFADPYFWAAFQFTGA